jgi:hypothetical protein
VNVDSKHMMRMRILLISESASAFSPLIISNLVRLCGAEALHDEGHSLDVRNLSVRDCDTPKS